MLAVRGAGSEIVKALVPMLKDVTVSVPRTAEMPTDADRYLFCAGVLRAAPSYQQSEEERDEAWKVNFWRVRDDCDRIFDKNETARICVIGSESAYRGSFDDTYSTSKKCLHEYVERKKLRPGQQLVCISPSVIEDAGMNARREDEWRCQQRKEKHPKRRFLKAEEVARLIYSVLYIGGDYLTSVVIRLNGGEHNA